MSLKVDSPIFPSVRYLPSGALMALCPNADGALTERIFSDPCALASARCPIPGIAASDAPLADAKEALRHFFFEAPFFEKAARRMVSRDGFTTAGAAAVEELMHPGTVFFRGDPDAFIVGCREEADGFSIACTTAVACSLTFRVEDVLMRMGVDGERFSLNLSLLRDANRRDVNPEAGLVEEQFGDLPCDVRVFLDFSENGGAVMRFAFCGL